MRTSQPEGIPCYFFLKKNEQLNHNHPCHFHPSDETETNEEMSPCARLVQILVNREVNSNEFPMGSDES
jgi:hypothetical protein